MKPLEWIELGRIEYQAGRAAQDELVAARARGDCRDACLILEHSPVLTLGKRRTAESVRAAEVFRARGIQVAETNRGGEATYHGPGQLIVYPVVSLRERGYGVRSFVERGLGAITDALKRLGIAAECRAEPAGVWVGEEKIASVGLRVEHGVTNHGFALNVSNDLGPYALFSPCGQPPGRITSVEQLVEPAPTLRTVSDLLAECFRRRL